MFGNKKEENHITEKEKSKASYALQDISQEFFNASNWHYKKRNVQIVSDENKILFESKNKKVKYVTLLENNTNFEFVTKGAKKLTLDQNNMIQIRGKKSGSIQVIIYLIEYDANHKRINTNKIPLNTSEIIVAKKATKYARIAIRMVGKGELAITHFITSAYSAEQMLQAKQEKTLKDINVACIFDEFSMKSFSDVVTLTTFSPDNWLAKFEKHKPDVLMVESAWQGNFGAWQYQIGRYNNNNDNAKLKDLIMWCKRNRVPTVFWNKEDPVHFDKFKDAASLFDLVLTTDSNMIPKYREYVGHSHVYSMQFAANPLLHNPISIVKPKKNKISFAGSYYANRHEDRKKDMDDMLALCNEFGLDIYDRNYERNQQGPTDFMFPEQYRENVIGTLKYDEIYKAYKDYRLVLNVNSVKYSPTMFSRRVFETIACGTPLVSSYSIGIKKLFDKFVVMEEEKEEARLRVEKWMTDDRNYRETALAGMREIFKNHTYRHRMEFILDKLSISYQKDQDDVTIIFSIETEEEFYRALTIVNEQTYEDVKVIFLISLFEGYEEILNQYNDDRISTYIRQYAFKFGAIETLIQTKYVTVMQLNYKYGKHYIEDLVYAGLYSNADVIGKKVIEQNGDYSYSRYEYEYVDTIRTDTALYRVESIKNNRFQDILEKPEVIIDELFRQHGKRIFSSDKFNVTLN